jgi:ABC-type amino acid transport substrate-binding protein
MQRRQATSLLVSTLALGLPSIAWAGDDLPQDLPQIRARGVLKIGTSGTAPPNTWVNAKNELTGYDIDWGNMISKELALPLRWVKVDFRGLMPALSSKQLDMVITGVRIRENLKKIFLFSEPYAYERMVAVVRSDDAATATMQSITELAGRTVGVVAASFQEDAIRRIGGYRDLLTMPSGSDVFLSLYTRHIDVAVTGLTAAVHYQKARPGEVRIVSEGGGVNAQGIVMQKSAVELKAAVDRVVERARADGTYLALYRKNFGIDPPQ